MYKTRLPFLIKIETQCNCSATLHQRWPNSPCLVSTTRPVAVEKLFGRRKTKTDIGLLIHMQVFITTQKSVVLCSDKIGKKKKYLSIVSKRVTRGAAINAKSHAKSISGYPCALSPFNSSIANAMSTRAFAYKSRLQMLTLETIHRG